MTLKEQILTAIGSFGPMTFQQLAERIQPKSTGSLRVTLSGMVNDRLLEPVGDVSWRRAYKLVEAE